MKNILFITWDGPQTNYLEGLFLPIFNEIQDSSDYKFHVIQFTWGLNNRIEAIKQKAEELNITYTSKLVNRKPSVIIGSILSINTGKKLIEKYIAENAIDIVMPRSTMPAIMVNRIKDRKFKLVFDADGLPLEERVNFAGLSPKSLQYTFLKREETKMLSAADSVLTRSKLAVKIHLTTISGKNLEKFSVVTNGRNIDFFKPDVFARSHIRRELKANDNTTVFVYCGSLGPQYSWGEMMNIFEKFHQRNGNSKFLILTGNVEYAYKRLPSHLKDHISIKNLPFESVPSYLSAGDIAFALREPKYSMKAVSPIKLGEYLLMGIPTIASKGMGDSDNLLKKNPHCFLYNHYSNLSLDKAVEFVEYCDHNSQEKIRAFGIENFSIEKSASTYVKSLNSL